MGNSTICRLMDWVYPVGSVIASVNAAFDPNRLYSHQTWERFARGRVLVGVDEADAAFSAAEKTGGEKTHKLSANEMPKHSHSYNYLTNWDGTKSSGYAVSTTASGKNNQSVSYAGGDAAHNNLQPYAAVYYWKRTA